MAFLEAHNRRPRRRLSTTYTHQAESAAPLLSSMVSCALFDRRAKERRMNSHSSNTSPWPDSLVCDGCNGGFWDCSRGLCT